MCGRYASYLPPDAIAALFRTVNPLPNIGPTWNMAPTRDALAVRRHPDTGERHRDLLTRGFLPHWTTNPKQARRPLNAKAETVASSGMFRDAFARRPCLIPAGAVFEWRPVDGKKVKQPFAIARQDRKPMALAGIWEGWRGEGGGDPQLRDHHHGGQPAHVAGPQPDAGDPGGAGLAGMAGERAGDWSALLCPAQDVLRLWPVNRLVNNGRNDGPELLELLDQAT